MKPRGGASWCLKEIHTNLSPALTFTLHSMEAIFVAISRTYTGKRVCLSCPGPGRDDAGPAVRHLRTS